MAGKALHKVDFKDFIQLATVLTDEKECINLLKTLTKSSESLIGAAYNLWRSISGVKWLFEAKRLLRKDGDTNIELRKLIELDTRAKQLGINYD